MLISTCAQPFATLIPRCFAGKGKTLVAVMAMDHFLLHSDGKLAIFVVPANALASQQASFCKAQSLFPSVISLTGESTQGWSKQEWDDCVHSHRILVGTAEIFKRALSSAELPAALVAIAVFDECHNACGSSPMKLILQGELQKHKSVRLLGMSASFVHGKMHSVPQKKEVLCQLFGDAHFVVESSETRCTTKCHKIDFRQEDHDWSCIIEQSLGGILSSAYAKPKLVKKALNNGKRILMDLG
jgi:superfamily II DNA or RNA helicase